MLKPPRMRIGRGRRLHRDHVEAPDVRELTARQPNQNCRGIEGGTGLRHDLLSHTWLRRGKALSSVLPRRFGCKEASFFADCDPSSNYEKFVDDFAVGMPRNNLPWREREEAYPNIASTYAVTLQGKHAKVPWIKTGEQILTPEQITEFYITMGDVGTFGSKT
jgi:hypothetical protein